MTQQTQDVAMQFQQSGWRLDKHVSWGHIMTTLTMIVTTVMWGSQIDARTKRNALEIQHVKSELAIERPRVDDLRLEIKGDSNAINVKLDKLLLEKR